MDVIFLTGVIASVLAFFVGLTIVVVNVAYATFGRAGVAKGLSSIDAIYGANADPDKLAAPGVSNRVAQLSRAATPSRALEYLRRRLDFAGNPPYWTVDRLFEIKGLALIVGLLVGLAFGFVAGGALGAVIGLVIGAPLGFFVPDIVLYDVSERRQDRIRRTLPDILDTLTVSVEAGLGFDAALAQITRYGRGPLAGEFARVLQEMQIGVSRMDALRSLGQRTNITELRSFCAIVVQATELGVPIANVLREQSKEMRVRRRQRAEEAAQKVPVKILFPLIFCLFPALFIVVLGPGVINIVNVLDLFLSFLALAPGQEAWSRASEDEHQKVCLGSDSAPFAVSDLRQTRIVATALQPVRRIAAYGICADTDGRVLLVRASPSSGTPGVWSLPGGAIDHGEHPFDTVVRETAAETGLSVGVARLVDVLSDLRALPERGVAIHTDRLIYEVTLRGGILRDRVDYATDLARFVPRSELAGRCLRPFTATALGVPASPADVAPEEPPELPSFYAVPGPDGLHRAQRFAAYAVATDPRGRVLLTRIAEGYPGGGRWHLPGGGTDYGEQPGTALIRELAEETGQRGRLLALLGVASHRDAASLGPEGYPIDWHGVRAFYSVMVDRPTRPRVHDVGGSTSAARWFRPDELADLPITEVTTEALRRGPVGPAARPSGGGDQ